MPGVERVPSGRAGKLWLIHRITVAERGAEQLERKTQILSAEVARRRNLAEQRRSEWVKQCSIAERWLLRASLIAGHESVRDSWAPPADVALTWTSTMGVRHPATTAVTEADGIGTATPTVATVYARQAYRTALQHAVDSAVADAALAALEEALLATRRRARILRRHWLPRLQAQLHDLLLALEQSEQEDQARLRRSIR